MACFSLGRLAAKALTVAVAALLVVSMMMLPGFAGTTDVQAASQSPNGAPAPQEKQGDLSHLVYTAQTGLVATAISPVDGAILNLTATSFEVATVAGAGVEIAVNGRVVPVKKLGRRAELEDGSLRYTYYGVTLTAGRNEIVLTPLGAHGLRGSRVTEHVWGPGPPALVQEAGCAAPRADGRTPCAVRIAVLDEWGHPAAPGATVKVAIESGDAVIQTTGIAGGEAVPDASPLTTSNLESKRSLAIVLSVGSMTTIEVVPGTTPGRIEVAASIADISAKAKLDAMAFARPPIVTGLATVGIGAVPGEAGLDPTIANGTNSRYGRVALYGTGALGGNAVGSLAYDTAGSLAATTLTGALNDDPNDRPYATYGDASIRRNDALTQDKLFTRIDDGYDSAMWGEFAATTGPVGTAGAVALQVDGAKVALGSATTSGSAFSASNQVGYGRQVLSPTGLATLTTLAHDNLIVGSESVTLVSLDRHTGAILSQTVLQNVVDYAIDYTSGIIRFINVPLPYDASFNPQEILVNYEYSAVGGGARTTGGRFDTPLGRFDGANFGLGYLNDTTGTGDFTLVTENGGGLLPGGTWSFSHAGSDGLVPGVSQGSTSGGNSGSAFRFGGAAASGPLKLSFGYDTTSAGYGNPFGNLSTPGLTDYHAAVDQTFSNKRGGLTLSYEKAQSEGLGLGVSTETNLTATLHEKLTSRLTAHAGLIFHASDLSGASIASTGTSASGPTISTLSPSASPNPSSNPTRQPTPLAAQAASVTQAQLGFDWKVLHGLELSVERDETIGGSDRTQPAQSTAQASLDLDGHGRIYATELLSDAPVQSFGSLAGIGSATHAFTLGIEQTVNPNTSVDTEYAISGAGNGNDISSAIGVKERLRISNDLKGDAFVQRGVSVGAISGDYIVYGLALAYGDRGGRVKLTGSLQDRTGAGDGATWSIGGAGKLFGDLSLVGADQGSRALGGDTTDERLALAWRPSASDRGALFAGYQQHAGNADVDGAQSGVISLDGVYRLTRRLQLTGRLARKTDGDSSYAVGTSLVEIGARQQITPRYDVGIETHEVLSHSAGGGLHSTATEFGSMVGATLRVAFGYNFGATADSTLAAAPTRKGIYVTVTTVIDRIFGWGAH